MAHYYHLHACHDDGRFRKVNSREKSPRAFALRRIYIYIYILFLLVRLSISDVSGPGTGFFCVAQNASIIIGRLPRARVTVIVRFRRACAPPRLRPPLRPCEQYRSSAPLRKRFSIRARPIVTRVWKTKSNVFRPYIVYRIRCRLDRRFNRWFFIV